MNTRNRHWVQSSPLLLIFTFTSKLCFLFSLSPECTSAPHLAPELPATYEEYFDFLQWRSPARFFVWPNALLACWREIGWYSMNNSTDVRLLRPSEGVVQLCFSLFHSSVLLIGARKMLHSGEGNRRLYRRLLDCRRRLDDISCQLVTTSSPLMGVWGSECIKINLVAGSSS
jgi:hypothetical protein